MPSSSSKQKSYPCPLIGNGGDYDESAKMVFRYKVEKFPKKLIFHFEKPEISDSKIQDLLDKGEVNAFAEFNSPATFNFFCKKLNFSEKNYCPIEVNYGELNRKVRIRFFLASAKDSVINPLFLSTDYPSDSFLANELDMLGISKAIYENIDHQFDPFQSDASSIFMITPHKEDTESHIVDFKNDKINIKLPEESFKEYQFIKKDSNIPMFHCAIIFPVLIDAFNIIENYEKNTEKKDEEDDYSSKRWYGRLKDLKELRELRGSSYEMANKLLNNPVVKLIQSNYLQEKSMRDGDDDE